MRCFLDTHVAIAIALILGIPFGAPAQPAAPGDLTQFSLEELMNVQVTSVSKKDQTVSKVASAIYVIDLEDIRRSGATSIPDLLRMVPGVDVAQIDAHTWAISVRGFNERFTRSVLVLIDGRSVYSPLFGGVNWDQQDVPLEDIERIEVIRGPGGTVWGANAVNGVINIITKSSSATKGSLVRAGGGSQDSANALTQYGGAAGGKGSYRIFGGYESGGDFKQADGSSASDAWHSFHAGFRSDWILSPRDSLTVQGDLINLDAGQTVGSILSTSGIGPVHDDRVNAGAGNVLGRWKRTLSKSSDISLQVYYDRYNRVDTGLQEIRDTVDIDFQYHLKIGSRNDVVWGLGYRDTRDDDTPLAGGEISLMPPRQSENLFSTFVQDEIRLTDSVSLTAGSKLEHNGYTGFEYEPSVQLEWSPNPRQQVWISAARAIRQPTRTDEGVHVENPFLLPNGGAGLVTLTGDPDAESAVVHDLEIGYRVQINKKISVDVATFLSYYYGLLTAEPGAPYFSTTPVPELVVPEQLEQLSNARSFGGEVSANWVPDARWKLSAGYSTIFMKTRRDPTSRDPGVTYRADSTPEYQFQARSLLNLTRKTEFDTSLFYVSSLRGSAATPGYVRLDARIGRRIGEYLDMSVVGQNLLSPRHPEFADAQGLLHTLATRAILGRLTWRF